VFEKAKYFKIKGARNETTGKFLAEHKKSESNCSSGVILFDLFIDGGICAAPERYVQKNVGRV
jgi:hypothetical protein